MARYERFTFLCDPNERQAIADLAERLSRSQSDAVRYVVVEAAKQLTQATESVQAETGKGHTQCGQEGHEQSTL